MTDEQKDLYITATEAKNTLGKYFKKAKTQPVFINVHGNVDSVLLSYDHYKELEKNGKSAQTNQRLQRSQSW